MNTAMQTTAKHTICRIRGLGQQETMFLTCAVIKAARADGQVVAVVSPNDCSRALLTNGIALDPGCAVFVHSDAAMAEEILECLVRGGSVDLVIYRKIQAPSRRIEEIAATTKTTIVYTD